MREQRKIILAPFTKVDKFDDDKHCFVSISWFPPENWKGKQYASLMLPSREQEEILLQMDSNKTRGWTISRFMHEMENITDNFRRNLYEANVKQIFEDVFRLADGKIPVLMNHSDAKETKLRHLIVFYLMFWLEEHPNELSYEVSFINENWYLQNINDNITAQKNEADGVVAESDPQDPNEAAKEAEKRIAIAVLEEFNKWRRGHGEYSWNEDPSKNKILELTPKQMGLAIDYAVEFLKTH